MLFHPIPDSNGFMHAMVIANYKEFRRRFVRRSQEFLILQKPLKKIQKIRTVKPKSLVVLFDSEEGSPLIVDRGA